GGVISGQVAAGAAAAGPYLVTVTATDQTYSGSLSFWWDIAPVVAFTDPGDQFNTEGDTVALPLPATDSRGAALTYTVSGLPPGLSWNDDTDTIEGVLAAGAASGGPYQVTVSATDNTYSSTLKIWWDVAPAVTITDPGPQLNMEGDNVSLALAASD